MITCKKVLAGAEEVYTAYEAHLRLEERSENTIRKYLRDLHALYQSLSGRELSKEAILEWRDGLTTDHATVSVNSMLAAVNHFLTWAGFPQFKVRPLRVQHEIFRKPEKELSEEEYHRLVKAAEDRNNIRLALLLKTICSTGIRVSELRFVTVESLKVGRAVVNCKGKQRVIFLPSELCRVLRRYCRDCDITHGSVFQTKSGKPLDRSNIWKDMKALCESARVEPGKVFPHNLRHLFARTYYRLEKDLSRLADLLGHTSVSTTRIYTMESGEEHMRQVEKLGGILLKI